MKKKIAVPVDNRGVLDAHFGHCKFFRIIEIENGEIIGEESIVPPPHEPGVLPGWLANRGVNEIIAGGIGQKAISLFKQQGVNVLLGAPKLPVKELIDGYLDNTLEFSANYCDH